MTEKDFILWLHGFFEISNAKTLDENQVLIIKDHLKLFFEKVTPNREAAKIVDKDLVKRFGKHLQNHFDKAVEDLTNPAWQHPVFVPSFSPTLPVPENDPFKITCETNLDFSATQNPLVQNPEWSINNLEKQFRTC